jgi:hypothetical protein
VRQTVSRTHAVRFALMRRARHNGRMATPCTEQMAPVESQVVTEGENTGAGSASPPRRVLPKDLAAALKALDDAEIDSLLEAVTSEAKRRNRMPSDATREKVSDRAIPAAGQGRAVDTSPLTTGQLNAVRAAFKAGVKPALIARQFRISQADVRNALASEMRTRPTSP